MTHCVQNQRLTKECVQIQERNPNKKQKPRNTKFPTKQRQKPKD